MTNPKHAPRLSADVIRAVERILEKEGRRAEITRTESGVRVVELTHRTAYREAKHDGE